MLNKIFSLKEAGTTVRREIIAGTVTFLTMAYIIFVQPAVLSGKMFGMDTGIDFHSVFMATCLASAFTTMIMAFWVNYPIALAPGMGENFFFIFAVIPAAAAAGFQNPWQTAFGVTFISGIIFFIISILGIRKILIDAISPSLRTGIAVGIGIFIAFIGLQNSGIIIGDQGTLVKLNTRFASPDVVIFFLGFWFTSIFYQRKIRGAILFGIFFTALLAVLFRASLPLLWPLDKYPIIQKSMLFSHFIMDFKVISMPPSIEPTFFQFDLKNALTLIMLPYIIIFVFMDLFDTLGTTIGVAEQGKLLKNNQLPRANRIFMCDSLGTTAGAVLGTSTVTAFIESCAGVEFGGRTGLTSLTVAVWFLLALFFSPLIAMIGSYPVITAPALLIVGTMMMNNIRNIDWDDFSEVIPAFIVIIGIPLTYSISDGIALGFITYPIVKFFGGKGKDVHWMLYILSFFLVVYFIFIR